MHGFMKWSSVIFAVGRTSHVDIVATVYICMSLPRDPKTYTAQISREGLVEPYPAIQDRLEISSGFFY